MNLDPIIFKRVPIIRKKNPIFYKIEGNFKNMRFEYIFRVTFRRQNDKFCFSAIKQIKKYNVCGPQSYVNAN